MNDELIHERVITYDGSGGYSDVVTLYYLDNEQKNITFYIQPETLYTIVHAAIVKLSQTKDSYNENLTPEMNALKRKLSAIVRGFIRGGLLLWGDDLLNLLYGKTDHPRPPKKQKVDILDWYMDQFTQISIASLMRNDTILNGTVSHVTDQETTITVLGVDTRPIPGKQALLTEARIDRQVSEDTNERATIA